MDDVQLNATAGCVLGLLLLGPVPGAERDGGPDAMTGWQIWETAAASVSRFWNVTRSQVYRELSSLAGGGLVEACGDVVASPRRPYRITARGREAFLTWLSARALQEPADDQVHSPLLLLLTFAGHLPAETVLRVVQEYRLRYLRQREPLLQMQRALGPEDATTTAAAVLRLVIAGNEQRIDWLTELLRILPAG